MNRQISLLKLKTKGCEQILRLTWISTLRPQGKTKEDDNNRMTKEEALDIQLPVYAAVIQRTVRYGQFKIRSSWTRLYEEWTTLSSG